VIDFAKSKLFVIVGAGEIVSRAWRGCLLVNLVRLSLPGGIYKQKLDSVCMLLHSGCCSSFTRKKERRIFSGQQSAAGLNIRHQISHKLSGRKTGKVVGGGGGGREWGSRATCLSVIHGLIYCQLFCHVFFCVHYFSSR
jgi:hypothetical protein